MTSKELERDAKIEVAEVPSAAWGWSRINHRTWHATGVVIVIFLLAMLRGNHVGHIENLYLVGFAVIALFVIARDWWRRRRGNLY
ncbi:MAG TPA: DUF2631 domain-containing protein [Mycobacterium sp.]|nr:DUF2631 domain-containing protein [Mycobacterium sp.]